MLNNLTHGFILSGFIVEPLWGHIPAIMLMWGCSICGLILTGMIKSLFERA